MTFSLPVLAPGPARFAFSCNRCGNCCSNQTGYVWVEPGEIAAMAAKLGIALKNFIRNYIKNAGGRLSLVERAGRCALLADKNACSVYDARPEHCKQFPFWPSVLGGGEALDRARAACPGIHEAPPRLEREAAYNELRAFYRFADARIAEHKPKCALSGNCCDFPAAGHKLYATILETDYAADHGPGAGSAEGAAEREDWCAFYHSRLCHARDVRPLACRAYYCDASTSAALAELHEQLLAELRALARRRGYPEGYGDFAEILPARRAALEILDGAARNAYR